MKPVEKAFLEWAAISWQATAVIGILAGLRWALRRHIPANWMFTTWLLLAGMLLIPWPCR